MEQIEQQLTALIADQKAFNAKVAEDIKTFGEAQPENKAAIETIRAAVDKLQTQLDAIDAKNQERIEKEDKSAPSIGEDFTKSERFLKAHADGFRTMERVPVAMDRSMFPTSPKDQKALLANTSFSGGTSGIGMPGLLVGTPLIMTQIELRLRNIMRTRPLTTGNTYYWLRQTTRTNAASPQVEGSAKAESTYLWDTLSDDVSTIAHYTNVTTQALADIPWLREAIDSELMYGLLLKEEQEILAGAGTGQHLNGLITQATAYDTALNVTADTKLDKLRHAKLQARLLGQATFAPSAIVVHPTDMHTIELIKDAASNVGNYVVGEPKAGTPIKMVWGLPVVESDSMTAGTFLVGAFNTGAVIVDRMQATIDISFEHASNFIENKATIRCEERIGLAVTRPSSFIYGSY